LRSDWKWLDSYSIEQLSGKVREIISSEKNVSDERVIKICEEICSKDTRFMLLRGEEKKRIIRSVFCTLRCELEILQDLADDAEVSEIMVNGKDHIFIERKGIIERVPLRFESRERLEHVIQRLAAKVGREMNDLNPIVDARLSDGSRINAINSNIAINGPVLSIRKFSENRLTMEELISHGDITRDAADFVTSLVVSGYNIFVSGGTSSGKTTFLNVLSDYIPKNERIIVIEDSAELALRGHENLVRLEAKNANAQGKGGITIKDLIKASLRQRPDRIIVGEVRSGEVVDMIAAMSTGHDGSLSTGHANSPRGMLGRLETLYLSASSFPIEAIRSQIAEAIDIFVHLARTSDGKRRVIEITELAGYEEGNYKLNTIYKYKPGEGLMFTGSELINREKLSLRGFC